MSEAAPSTAPTATPTSSATPSTQGQSSTSSGSGITQSHSTTRTNTPAQQSGNGMSQESATPQFYEVKINNKPVKMTLQELMDRASMSHAATERFQKAAELERKYNKFKETATKDPIHAMLDPELGLTKEQIREKLEDYYYNEYVEPEKMSPAERDLKAAQQRLKQYEEQEQKRQADLDQQKEEETLSRHREMSQQQIIEALEANTLLPKTDPFIVSRMAFYMRQNNMNGWDAPMDMIVRQVHNDTKDLVGSLCKNMNGEQLVNMLPPEVVNTLLKYQLDKMRKGRNEIQTTQSVPTQLPKKQERIDMSDVEKNLTKMRTGKFSW